jgi:hypothetical protein
MKSSSIVFLLAGLVLGCAALPSANGAGTINAKDAKANGAKGTNAEPAVLPIPVSVFDLGATPTKDPFFPTTLRAALPKNDSKVASGVSATSFQLGGLSGSTDDPLAIINHRTLGMGETREVPLPTGGKATIRIIQFKGTSVVIKVVIPPQPDLIELSLSKRAR